ncbi:APC family permease [Vulcanisaeta thermophila]|uniref:APC family permease n=1 Tax=Vulcanisaeta thermophila TaxID=867917 RepID=UPI0008536D5A|nr:APC family permease [Vulcanisaeta thermophila]
MARKVTWLKRELGTIDLFALGYSDVSSTYYFTLGVIALYSGSLLPLTMLLGSLSLWLVGLAYAEFGSAIPRSGGAYYYVKRGLGDFWGFVAGWLLGFDQVLMIAYGALGTVNYLGGVVTPLSRWPLNSLMSIVVVLILMGINIAGIKTSARFNLALLLIDLSSIALIIIMGYYLVLTHALPTQVTNTSLRGTDPLSGLSLSLRGYIGIDVIAQSAGEAMSPAVSIPRSILGVSSLSTAVALLISTLALITNNITTLSTNLSDPITALATQLFHNTLITTYVSLAITVVLLISVNAGIVDFSRNMYIMSEDGLLHTRLREVHGRYRTPYISIITASLIALLFIVPGSVELIANSYGIASIMVYLLTMASLMAFRNREKHLLRHFNTPAVTLGTIKLPLVALGGIATYTLAIVLVLITRPIYLLIVCTWLIVGLVLYSINKVSRHI